MKKETVIKEILNNFQVPEGRTKDENWAQIDSKIKSSVDSSSSTLSIKRFLPLGIAAAIAFAFVFFWNPSQTSFSSNLEYKSVDLPDGSKAELGPNSSLTFTDNGNSRILELDGSAYFNVQKGKPFIVKSTSCEVKVLGTSFKVNDLDDKFDVKCYTGLVQVSAEKEVYKLTAGKGVNSNDQNTIYEHTENYSQYKSSLEYQNEYLSSVLLDLKVKRNLTIINRSASNPVITYSIKNESSSKISSTLATISGLKLLSIDENTYELK